MDEISNSKSKKTMLFVIVIMGAFLVLVGVSYAYFVAFVTSDEQEIQSGVLELTYNTGKDILLEKGYSNRRRKCWNTPIFSGKYRYIRSYVLYVSR